MSDIAHYLLRIISLSLLRQEISVTYRSLRNIYLGALEAYQEPNLQGNDNHHGGLPLHWNSSRDPHRSQQTNPALAAGSAGTAPETLQPSSDKKSEVCLC